MTRRRSIHDILASHTDQYEIHQQLHDVPPHAVYEASVDGRRAVCKLATGARADPATEGSVLAYVGRETTIPVPTVLAIGSDHVLMTWDDAAPQSGAIDESKARTMGAGLARLHNETADRFETYGVPRSNGTSLTVDEHDRWVETVQWLLRDRHDYLVGTGYAESATAVIEFFDDYPTIVADPDPPVLCHGNFLPDHVAVDEETVASVIDFEHALVAPPEYDYWRTAIPLGTTEPDTIRRAFRNGYTSVRSIDIENERRRQAYWLLNAVSYLKALFLQENVPEDTMSARADRLAEKIRKRIRILRTALPETSARDPDGNHG